MRDGDALVSDVLIALLMRRPVYGIIYGPFGTKLLDGVLRDEYAFRTKGYETMIHVGQATAKSVISAPLEAIDLGDWMFTLTSEEYAACARGHQSAAQGTLPSGKRVSMNVEVVGGFFMVQHYVEKTAERDHVVGVSPNTVMWLDDKVFVLAQITWELKVARVDDGTSELTCNVVVETDNEAFAARVAEINRDIPPEDTAFQQHIDEETPLFGADIGRKALRGVWTPKSKAVG